jgi:hypothetical protein
MTNITKVLTVVVVLLIAVAVPRLQGQEASATVPVHMVVTAESTKDTGAPPDLDRRDIVVKQGKNRLQVTDWIPARGEQAGLQLFILIDDTCDSGLGSYLDELRSFINAQPATTLVAIGYMRNATITTVQDFTADHAQAAKALRLPLGSLSTQDSPYLSLASLLKRWPESKVRREVIMVTDGIDRLRSAPPSTGPGRGPYKTPPRTIPYISVDVDTASIASQRSGVIVHTIYAPGVGRAHRNFYEAQNGLNGMAKLSDETGGESFALTAQPAVSFQPYLDRLQTILGNQYFLVFQAKPGDKAGLQRVKLETEVPNVEFAAADNVWVPARTGSGKKQ